MHVCDECGIVCTSESKLRAHDLVHNSPRSSLMNVVARARKLALRGMSEHDIALRIDCHRYVARQAIGWAHEHTHRVNTMKGVVT